MLVYIYYLQKVSLINADTPLLCLSLISKVYPPSLSEAQDYYHKSESRVPQPISHKTFQYFRSKFQITQGINAFDFHPILNLIGKKLIVAYQYIYYIIVESL